MKGILLGYFVVLTNSNYYQFYVIHIYFNLVNFHIIPLCGVTFEKPPPTISFLYRGTDLGLWAQHFTGDSTNMIDDRVRSKLTSC